MYSFNQLEQSQSSCSCKIYSITFWILPFNAGLLHLSKYYNSIYKHHPHLVHDDAECTYRAFHNPYIAHTCIHLGTVQYSKSWCTAKYGQSANRNHWNVCTANHRGRVLLASERNRPWLLFRMNESVLLEYGKRAWKSQRQGTCKTSRKNVHIYSSLRGFPTLGTEPPRSEETNKRGRRRQKKTKQEGWRWGRGEPVWHYTHKKGYVLNGLLQVGHSNVTDMLSA